LIKRERKKTEDGKGEAGNGGQNSLIGEGESASKMGRPVEMDVNALLGEERGEGRGLSAAEAKYRKQDLGVEVEER